MPSASIFYIETDNKDVFEVMDVVEAALIYLQSANPKFSVTKPKASKFFSSLSGTDKMTAAEFNQLRYQKPRFEITPRLKMCNCIFIYDGHIRNLLIQLHVDDDMEFSAIYFRLYHNSDEGGEVDCLRSVADYITGLITTHEWIKSIWFCEDDCEGEEYICLGKRES